MDIRISVEDFYEILGEEIDWHVEHYNESDLNFMYKVGFIDGLKQAKNLLIDAEIAVIKGRKWVAK